MRRALCSLHWFPDYLAEKLKAIIRFCRDWQADIRTSVLLRSRPARVRFHFLPGGAGTRWRKLSRCGLHVRILPSGFPPAVLLRQGERPNVLLDIRSAAAQKRLPTGRSGVPGGWSATIGYEHHRFFIMFPWIVCGKVNIFSTLIETLCDTWNSQPFSGEICVLHRKCEL